MYHVHFLVCLAHPLLCCPQGREDSLFATLAKEYGTPNPLQEPSVRYDGQTTAQSTVTMIDDSSPYMESVEVGRDGSSSIAALPQPLHPKPYTSSTSQENSAFSFANGSSILAPIQASSSSSQVSPSPFSSFGQGLALTPSTLQVGNTTSTFVAPNAAAPTFGGKSPRELLTSFYQEKNPSKISDVDTLLAKYQVR
jgi:hypothetical protein